MSTFLSPFLPKTGSFFLASLNNRVFASIILFTSGITFFCATKKQKAGIKTLSKKLKVTLIVVAIILFLIIAFCGYKIITLSNRYKTDREAYDKLREEYAQTVERPDAGNEDLTGNEIEDGESEEYWVYNDGEYDDSPVYVNFNAIQEKVNPEIVAWIKCEGTKIDYPVVHHTDNNYFLNHNANGDYAAAGAIFMSASNFSDFSDINTTIHGHHMNDGSMFGSLWTWGNQEYFDQHKVFYLNTPNGNYTITMIAYIVVPEDSDAYKIDFSGNNDVRNWVNWIMSESKVQSDYTYREGERYVGLSTCEYTFKNARGILIGYLTPLG